MTLFEKIKKLCNESGITFYRLEKDCGLSSQSIEKWEKSTPRGDTLLKVADYFNVTTDYLLGRTSDPHSASAHHPNLDFSQIPPEVAFAFSGGMDGLTQDDIDDLARLIKMRRELNKGKSDK